jgi:hypothetical protein
VLGGHLVDRIYSMEDDEVEYVIIKGAELEDRYVVANISFS